MLRQYFNCNERLEIFLTCFCNILCYVGNVSRLHITEQKDIGDNKINHEPGPCFFNLWLDLQNTSLTEVVYIYFDRRTTTLTRDSPITIFNFQLKDEN